MNVQEPLCNLLEPAPLLNRIHRQSGPHPLPTPWTETQEMHRQVLASDLLSKTKTRHEA